MILDLSRPLKTLEKPWNKDPDDWEGQRERKGIDKKGEHPMAHVVGCFASNDQHQDWEPNVIWPGEPRIRENVA